ncbi:MAG: hypothetical protein QXJ06_04450 [Candidatus Aenigmatarchaeota archaeon]
MRFAKYIFECGNCKYRGEENEFEYGRGKQYGEHPLHRYCPKCGVSIDWYGFREYKLINDKLQFIRAF